MKYKDISEENLASIHKFNGNEIVILWVDDYWDGPLESMCKVNSEVFKSIMFKESDNEVGNGWYRKYVLIRLSKQQLKEEIYWHNQFKKYVGNHWDTTEEEMKKGTISHPQSEYSKFYEPYKSKYSPDFSNNDVIGWYKI